MTALAVTNDQAWWDEKQLSVLKTLGLESAGKADLAMFLAYAQKTGLDPFTRQLYMIKRGSKFTIQASIDGFRVIADRACEQRGWVRSEEDTIWYDADGNGYSEWIKSFAPVAARYTVKVITPNGEARYTAVARFDEYAAQGGMWQKMPALMIAKCAEALALRKAFPQDLSGIYSDEEMQQADKPKRSQAQANPQPMVKVAPAPEWTDADQATARAAIGLANALDDLESLRQVFADNEHVADCPVDGTSLRREVTRLADEIRSAADDQRAEAAAS